MASEEIQFDAWGIDVVLSASQKGLGTPPGLSIVVASQKAIKVFETRSTRVTSYYASWKKCVQSSHQIMGILTHTNLKMVANNEGI